ncbi:MAG TPA: hypothetical protein VIJ25_05355, partial [Methylococcales bacterium]
MTIVIQVRFRRADNQIDLFRQIDFHSANGVNTVNSIIDANLRPLLRHVAMTLYAYALTMASTFDWQAVKLR